jgi:hypothetical protein
MADFYTISGRQPLLSRYLMGPQYSQWHAFNEHDVRTYVPPYTPCSAAHALIADHLLPRLRHFRMPHAAFHLLRFRLRPGLLSRASLRLACRWT